MLEPDDGKLSSPVLRRERGRKAPDLSGRRRAHRNLPGKARYMMGILQQLLGGLFAGTDESESEQLRRVSAEPFMSMGVELLGACDHISGSSGKFGYDISNPIPVNGVGGEIFYLNTLRARSGVGVFFRSHQESIGRIGCKFYCSRSFNGFFIDLFTVFADSWFAS